VLCTAFRKGSVEHFEDVLSGAKGPRQAGEIGTGWLERGWSLRPWREAPRLGASRVKLTLEVG